ncbi:uncharacterized protein LOC133903417 [Phragmites australis]|uniref:uncharacterized protein LOC133903417 n=1 Tax=Phragmites australis TaxID=29695 RepID=UPI002D77F968|nr:uncharacterized protein LOC133903417 [Phragmites australis]XP_062200776.1 uncharacterized protein LOC133903417 [Phragmites australis]
MQKVTISNVWHRPLVLIQKETLKNKPLEETAVVRVKAPLEATSRALINLVIVIDVSCSTAGEAALSAKKPSKLYLLKKALRFIIRQLRTGDHLTLVLNDNLTPENFIISEDIQKYAEKKVDELLAMDDTAFKPRLEVAVKILDKVNNGEHKKHLCFIVLLSDGLDDSKFNWKDGKNLADGEHLKKYPVHTFGLCKAHDPEALFRIAKESQGTYSSITENLSSKIIEALAVCLVGLKNVVAKNTVVTITAKNYRAWSTEITGIYYGGYYYDTSPIDIGVLYAGEVKDLVVHFKVKVRYLEQGASTYAPLSAKGNYDNPDGKVIIIKECKPEFSVYARLIETPIDERPLLPFPVVRLQMARIELLKDVMAKSLKEFEDWKKPAKGAKDKGDVLETAAYQYLEKEWKNFKESNKSWKNAQEIGLDLEHFENDIEAMLSSLKRLGMGCVYSWVSSYEMQRATTTGLPTTAFLTPKMQAEVQKALEKSAEGSTSSAAGSTHPSPPGEESGKSNHAIQLLNWLDNQLERCSELDQSVPPAAKPSSKQKGAKARDLTDYMQRHMYKAAVQTINEWRVSSGSGKQPHYLGSDKGEHESAAGAGTHHSQQNPAREAAGPKAKGHEKSGDGTSR